MATVTITLRIEDAEPILRKAAYEAAKFSAWCDHVTNRTHRCPGRGYGENLADARKRWNVKFLAAKRIVNSFGFEYEQTSEEETLTVHIPMKNQKRKLRKVAGMIFNEVSGGEPDYKHPEPMYRGEVHELACHAAADRVVRAWRAELENREAA